MPLDYYTMADQAGIRNDGPAQSGDRAIHDIALTPGAEFRPAEFESLLKLSENAKRQTANRANINTFYDDPERQNEINMTVQPQEESAFQGLLNQIRSRSREESFARARSGNIGGSVQADQQAAGSGDAARGGAQMSNQFAALRNQLEQSLQQARIQELLKSYDLDPQLLASMRQRVNTFGVADEGNALMEQLRRNEQGIRETNDDEYSRAWGNAINQAGTVYQGYQQQQMTNEQRAANAAERARQERLERLLGGRV